jgi:hypothetical protein
MGQETLGSGNIGVRKHWGQETLGSGNIGVRKHWSHRKHRGHGSTFKHKTINIGVRQ